MGISMQKIFIKLLMMLLVLAYLSACAIPHEPQKQVSTRPTREIQEQMAAILKSANSNEVIFILVPSPSNLISEKIMLASLAAGGTSNAIDQLTSILSSAKPSIVGITGSSNEINAITVKRTLEQLKDKSASGTVYLIADTKTQESLSALNQSMNIKLVFVE